VPGIAVSATAGTSAALSQKMLEGTLDLAVMYRPSPPPGLTIEHLFDEVFVLVSSDNARRPTNDYLLVDWGIDFIQDHTAAFPEHANPAITLDLGPMGLDFLLANECSGYFPERMVRRLIASGRVREPKRARKFVYPVYMVYPETRNEEAFEPIIRGLRRAASKFG
jgi:LysR family transcriptional regulator, flagellar master operon regulator